MKTVILGIIAVSAISIAACKKKRPVTEEKKEEVFLDNYPITSAGLYPEGIDYDVKNKRFVIGSFNKGAVYTLSADGKTFSQLITDPKLVAALGVYTDEANDRYIVLSGDAGASEKSGPSGSTAGKVAYVGFYSAADGRLIRSVDLTALVPGSGVIPNDLALDKDGNVYITDSFAPVIYRITKDYVATVFANNPLFAPAPGSFGLNGIVFHPDGYLLVAKTNDNKLFKVPISNPSGATEVGGLGDKIKAPDGLELTSDNKLVVIENGLAGGKAHLVSSSNAWATATQTGEEAIGAAAFPTTAALLPNGGIYVLQAKLGKLLGGDKTETSYTINRIKIK